MTTHDGAAVKARDENRTRTKPGPNLSDWPTQYNRSGSYRPSFTVPPAALRLLFLTISSTYLGTRCVAATRQPSASGRGIGTFENDDIRQTRGRFRKEI